MLDLEHIAATCIPGYDPEPAADSPWVFDLARAEKAVGFIEECQTHIEGALYGKPFLLEDWQKAIVANLFGWVHEETGFRRYRKALIFVPRKNGKSPLVACISNYMLFCDGEKGAQNFCAAADSKQAGKLFRWASSMVKAEPELMKRCKVYGGVGHRSIVRGSDGSFMKVLSSDTGGAHGDNSHFIAVDELHAIKDRDFVEVLQTSMASKNRTQPLMIMITTSDYEREGSICNETHEYACQVRDGVHTDDRFLPVIYEAGPDDDWTNQEVWRKANPNLGVSVSEEYLVSACNEAIASPAKENGFKRAHLNIRTEQIFRWIKIEAWKACSGKPDFSGKCFLGLDLANTLDIAAAALTFPHDDGGYSVKMRYWVPEMNIVDLEKKHKISYTQFAKHGNFIFTPGNTIDMSFIRKDIVEMGKKHNICGVAMDRWGGEHMQTLLRDDGFDVYPFGQGFASMSGPSKAFEAAVVSGKLRHGDDPALKWMADNVSAKTDEADNIKPDKKTSSGKIDGIVAVIMGIGLAIRGQDTSSIYNERQRFLVI